MSESRSRLRCRRKLASEETLAFPTRYCSPLAQRRRRGPDLAPRMARGKGTPRRNRDVGDDGDDDMSPVSRSPSNAINSPRRTTGAPGTAQNTASPSRLGLNHMANVAAPEKPARGPLPASAETTYHQRLRQILVDHRKARKAWNELVIRGLIGRTRAVLELWVDVECVFEGHSLLILLRQPSPDP